MPNRRSAGLAIASALAGAAAGTPSGAAARAAAAPRKVRVWATTDRPLVQPLIDDFEQRHAPWQVDYEALGSQTLHERFLAADGAGADVLWSSAMDLQIKLVNDGHAQRHASEHAGGLPHGAVWKHEAFATTWEPVALVHHRALLDSASAPDSHAALRVLLQQQRARFHQRVATYDIERAGLGFLLAAQDLQASSDAWPLLEALRHCGAELHADTQALLDGVAAGRTLLAYNVLGPYAEAFAQRHPDLVVVYPRDYTLIASRVALIPRRAPQPEGARLWLDHLLSPAGQHVLAERCGLYSVRADSSLPRSAAGLQQRLGRAARPIPLGPGLIAHLDRSKRQAILRRWQRAGDVAVQHLK
ncbi:ABC transporter substrate-binding protein [Aquabacterium humicola]|uniref:ABC transporter substrate-binding protein n=1 Tax=Aquabacterium humicola TaxID=3237377 RepID=UPI002542B825|nr:ABC transporter substrate-binding protein [Rubrivivax pictus]